MPVRARREILHRLQPQVMKRNGGYVVSTDHSVPDSVSLDDFRRFVELAKELAAY